MKKNNNDVFKATLIYVIISFLNKAIGIVTIPVFTKLLTTEEMGTTTTWISWMTILLPIATLSLTSGSYFIAMKEYKNERDSYQSSALILSSISTLFVFLIYVVFSDAFNKIFTLTTENMIVMFVYLLFSPAYDMWVLRKRYEYKVREMAVLTVTVNVLSAAVSILLVLIFRDHGKDLGEVRIYGMYSILILVSVCFYWKLIKDGRCFFDKKYWSFALKVSTPLIIHTLAKNILDVSDRTMISRYCGKSEAGIYGTIYQISTLSLIVWTAINNALVPYLYQQLDNNNKESVAAIKDITKKLIAIYGVVSIGMIAVAPELIKYLTSEEYYSAVYIIPPISIGVFLTCVYNIFADIILYHKKSVGVMIATIIASALNVLLNAIFIPLFGYYAAAYTTLAAFLILSITQGVTMKIVHKQDLLDIKGIMLFTSAIITFGLAFNLVYHSTIIRYSIIIILMALVLIFKKRILETIGQVKRSNAS